VSGPPAPASASPKGPSRRWVAAALASVAGGVDAIGYLTLFHLFTAHMSGNSVAFAAGVGAGTWYDVARRAYAIPFFLLGVALGAAVAELTTRRRVRCRLAVALGLEAVLLAAFMAAGYAVGGTARVDTAWKFAVLAGFATLGMGLQNGVLRRLDVHARATTYVSGLLTTMTEELVSFALARHGARSARRSLRRAGEMAEIYGSYVAAAALGGFTVHRVGFAALALPLAGLVLVIVSDLRAPIAPQALE
jgi:uncharacterized membrane protein YoaK (UPF0700 family)